MKNSNKHVVSFIFGIGVLILSLHGCLQSTSEPEADTGISQELYDMSRLVGEGHNYLLGKLIEADKGADWEIIKRETEAFYQSKGLSVDLSEEVPGYITKAVDANSRPSEVFKTVTESDNSVAFLNNLIDFYELGISEEWLHHLTQMAGCMDNGSDLGTYVESINTDDEMLLANLLFCEAVFDASNSFWSLYYGVNGDLSKTTEQMLHILIIDALGGALITAGDYATGDIEDWSDALLTFIISSATCSLFTWL